MEEEAEPIHYVDNEKYFKRLDEAYGFSCLWISQDIHVNINGLKNQK